MVKQPEMYLLLERIAPDAVVEDHRIFYARIPYQHDISKSVIEHKSVTHLHCIADNISKRFNILNYKEQSLFLLIYSDKTYESYCMYPIEKQGEQHKINTTILLAKNIHESYIN